MREVINQIIFFYVIIGGIGAFLSVLSCFLCLTEFKKNKKERR